ncbi:MAG: dihydrodipicolinate synthase family protein [Cytophagales bacterium]|nr:dihydrodipicolinate synthase family protein [Cytophagales bacterium]
MEKLPFGLWPVMITAFKADNTLDPDGVRTLTDMYLDAGANGMFANCLSSEMYQLTREERLVLTKTVVDHCKGSVPVVATGSFYMHGSENAEFIKEIHDLGVDAVILISSILAEPEESDDILKRRLEEIMEETGDIPLGLYECPVPYKRVIRPEMMGWLAESGRFWYHKDTSCDNAAIKKKLDKMIGSNYQLYNADTPTALESLKDGGKGISPISGNFYPELYGHFLKLYNEGDEESLESLNIKLTVMDRITHDFYPWSAKLFLEKRGLDICTNTRIPMSKMEAKDKNTLNALYKMFLDAMDEFEIDPVI